MNRVEDELFQDFCRAIGVDNIRQYEDRELQVWWISSLAGHMKIWHIYLGIILLPGSRGESPEKAGVWESEAAYPESVGVWEVTWHSV